MAESTTSTTSLAAPTIANPLRDPTIVVTGPGGDKMQFEGDPKVLTPGDVVATFLSVTKGEKPEARKDPKTPRGLGTAPAPSPSDADPKLAPYTKEHVWRMKGKEVTDIEQTHRMTETLASMGYKADKDNTIEVEIDADDLSPAQERLIEDRKAAEKVSAAEAKESASAARTTVTTTKK